MTTTAPFIRTDVLVVGTGPAGSATAALLSTHGVDTVVVSKFGWTSRTPRSHITNQRTMEILRDLGLEQEAVAAATPRELMGQNTYCTSLAGTELGRIRTWGTHPARMADHDLASPTRLCDLPQNLLEPILVNAAAQRGARVRFTTEYLSHVQDDEGVTTTVRDNLTGAVYDIRSRYLVGADGANSKVVADLGLPVEGRMGVSGSLNIVFSADLTAYVAHRPSVLYWVIQPGSDRGGLGIGVVRMVRPWHKWLAIWNYDLADGPPELDDEAAATIVRNLVGVDDLDVRVEATSAWTVNDAYVSQLSHGRVFCMGDAVHRHPPTNGLGSNVSIADAYNLAWKLAFVLRGEASAALLESYHDERAPIAKQTVTRANKSLGDFPPILGALGLLDTEDPARMRANMAELSGEDDASAGRRAALREAIDSTHYVYNTHGVEMNQRYTSEAVVSDGSPEPAWERDPELYFQASSRPGAPLPHAWVTRGTTTVSTHDLCGEGRFVLLTGNSGHAWNETAAKISAELGVALTVELIGPGQSTEDPFGEFAAVCETSESGALLVRPDHIVGWRHHSYDDTAEAGLRDALTRILALGASADRPATADSARLAHT
ncbi:FAD-dependent oxidoreductase [Salinactinospora qingdaonensis]|uniref:FAD-dependent monooxygenase n=1 Tax=Salinactinospora qingdaonensis TaxID=702744 RepID=A0ABP7FNL4_9ACTN